MGACKKCGTSIPNGKNFCTSHYMEELAKYQARLTEYNRDIIEWEQLSAHEKRLSDRHAERYELGVFSGIIGFVIGVFIWIILKKATNIDGLFGILIVVGNTLIFAKSGILRFFVGRFIRVMVFALVLFIMIGIVLLIISAFSKLIKEHSSFFIFGDIIASIIISFMREVSGKNHASGKPVRPTPPSP